MNAKQLFAGRLHENEDPTHGNSPGVPPAGRAYPERPPMRGGGDPRGGRSDIRRAMGAGGGSGFGDGPAGQFSAKETSQLKDVMIIILAKLASSDLDMAIGTALASGQPLEPGQLQHIVDEARNADIPESHVPLLQKIFKLCQQG